MHLSVSIFSKFALHQTVWFMRDNKVSFGMISAIFLNAISVDPHGSTIPKISYWVNSKNMSEEILFGSKKELLKSL